MTSVKNNKLAFPGLRGEFLAGEMDDYIEAVEAGSLSDVVASIQRRFFKRFPVSLEDDEDPSPEWLAQVDDNAAEPEINIPNEDLMTPDEYSTAMAEHNELMSKVEKKKDVSKVIASCSKQTHHPSSAANFTSSCLHVQNAHGSRREGCCGQ